MRIKTSKELPIGKIVYTVYGRNRMNTTLDPMNISKMIVMSKPKMVNLGGILGEDNGWNSPFIDVEEQYTNHDGELDCYRTQKSLCNAGIVDLGTKKNIYNLNRWFSSFDDAMEFLKELQNDKFSDPDDQAYADQNPSALDLIEREERMSLLQDAWDDLDYVDDYEGEI